MRGGREDEMASECRPTRAANVRRQLGFRGANFALTAFLMAVCLVYSVQPVVDLFRMLRVDWIAHTYKLTVPLASLATLVFVLRTGHRIFVLDRFRGLWFGYLLIGALVGFARENGNARAWLTQAWVPFFAVLMYAAGERLALMRCPIRQWLELMGVMLLTVFGACLAAFWIIKLTVVQGIFLGVSTAALVPIIALYTSRRCWSRLLLAGALVVASGKRGPMLAALFTASFASVVCGSRRRGLAVALPIVTIMLFAIGAAVIGLRLSGFRPEGAGPAQTIIAKVYSSLPGGEEWSADRATSGRNMEYRIAIAALEEVPLAPLWGLGLGWTLYFDEPVEGSTRDPFVQHYVHISPMNLVLTDGVPWAILLLLHCGWVCHRALVVRDTDVEARQLRQLVAAVFVGSTVSSVSGFHYGTDLIMWISLGWLSASTRLARTSALCPRTRVLANDDLRCEVPPREATSHMSGECPPSHLDLPRFGGH